MPPAPEVSREIVAEIETEPAGIDVAPEVLKLRRARADYVIFHGYVFTVWPEVMKQAVQTGIDAMFMGTFWAMEPMVVRQLGPLADRYLWGCSLPLLLGAGGVGDPAADGAGNAGEIPADLRPAGVVIMTEAIKRTLDAGRELTGDNLKAAIDGIEDWDTGGLIGVPVSFRNNSIPIGRIYQGNPATGRMDPVSDWIRLDSTR